MGKDPQKKQSGFQWNESDCLGEYVGDEKQSPII